MCTATGIKPYGNMPKKFDNTDVPNLGITAQELDRSCMAVGPEFLWQSWRAGANILRFHQKRHQGFHYGRQTGSRHGQKILP